MVLVTTPCLGYKNTERESRVLRSEKPRWGGGEGGGGRVGGEKKAG